MLNPEKSEQGRREPPSLFPWDEDAFLFGLGGLAVVLCLGGGRFANWSFREPSREAVCCPEITPGHVYYSLFSEDCCPLKELWAPMTLKDFSLL